MLLRSLYSKVLVPRSVADELDVGRAEDHDVPDVRATGWMEDAEAGDLADVLGPCVSPGSDGGKRVVRMPRSEGGNV